MDKPIKISELSKKEVEKIVKTGNFNKLAPKNCKACDYKGTFKRRIFEIEGGYKMGEDEYQNIIRYHMKQKYDFNNIYFKVNNNKNYIDTAFCNKCNSNMVIFDIELDEEVFEELAKHFNIPKDVIQNDMRKIHDMLS